MPWLLVALFCEYWMEVSVSQQGGHVSVTVDVGRACTGFELT